MPHPKSERRTVVVGVIKPKAPEVTAIGDDVARFVQAEHERVAERDRALAAGAPSALVCGCDDAAGASCTRHAGEGAPAALSLPRFVHAVELAPGLSASLEVARSGRATLKVEGSSAGLLPPAREESNRPGGPSLPGAGERGSGSNAPHGRKQSAAERTTPNDTRTCGVCGCADCRCGLSPSAPATPPAGSEAALLVAVAANLYDRAQLYVNPERRRFLADLADDLHLFATRKLGADPFGIGEGVRHG